MEGIVAQDPQIVGVLEQSRGHFPIPMRGWSQHPLVYDLLRGGGQLEVDAARRQLELSEKGQHRMEAPIQILRIGDAAVVGWPAEVYVELGLEVRQRSPFPLTFVASLANGGVGYIPTPAAYESQGKANEFGKYATSITRALMGNLPFRSDVGRILVEETLRLLNEM